VQNALGAVQSLLVLGGSSDIGAAIAERLVPGGCTSVVLAGRHPDAMEPVAERLRSGGAEVAIKAAWDARPGGGDIDCVVLAAGVLGEQSHLEDDPQAAAELVVANYAGPVSTLLHVARRLQEQGHGTIVVLSSVAGERARRSNFVYGSSKAGLDAFAQGLADSLVGTGVGVVVVRPGFVRTAMTRARHHGRRCRRRGRRCAGLRQGDRVGARHVPLPDGGLPPPAPARLAQAVGQDVTSTTA
jgi:decaprenylphospho-beta-D-erythro-pentofuranosid-2-ulose 2-reductase